MKKKQTAKKIRRALRAPFEKLGVALACLLLPCLSLKAILRLSKILADAAFFFDRYGRRVSAANLEIIAGKKLSRKRLDILTRGAYRNMMRVLLMIFWTTKDTAARTEKVIEFSDSLREGMSAHHPAVTISAHLGNWETLTLACEKNGFHMVSVAKDVKGRGFTERLLEARRKIGQEIVPAQGALKQLMRALKKGSSVGLLIDQHVEERDGGLWTEFFGLKAAVSQSAAMLAKRFNRPIIFGWSRPLKDGRFRCELGKIFLPEQQGEDIAACTMQLVEEFERVIRRHPSLWCINYCRWRYLIPGEDASRYPFYAKPAQPWQCPAAHKKGNEPS